MTDFGVSFTIVWAEIDLLEVELGVRFDVWSGAERMYATREELSAIADALESVANGGREASIQLGQPDLGFGHCRVFQYGGPRRLGMDVLVGHAGGMISNGTDYPRRVHVAIPLERGQLAQCASDLHKIIIAERGSVRSSAPPDWPD